VGWMVGYTELSKDQVPYQAPRPGFAFESGRLGTGGQQHHQAGYLVLGEPTGPARIPLVAQGVAPLEIGSSEPLTHSYWGHAESCGYFRLAPARVPQLKSL
jgi:hypothetical protein